jgi:hypothetical protein
MVATAAYTLEINALYGQKALQGDATKYVESAEGILAGDRSASFYPIYDYFLAALLWYGNSLTARIGQLLLLICSYCCGVLGLLRLGRGEKTITWFSRFICFNGIFYGLSTQLVRDSLLLTAFAIAFLCLATFQRRGRRGSTLVAILIGGGVAAMMAALSNWLLYVLMAAVIVETIGRVADHNRRNGAVALVVVTIAAITLLLLSMDHLALLYRINVEQDMAREGFYDAYGVENSRSLLDLPKALLGPGLLRPIMWHEYFWYSTDAHSAMYWWGCAAWYCLLLMVASALVLRPGNVWRTPGARFAATAFICLVSIYSYAYGSGMGMRKRAVFQFLFLLAVASAGFFEQREVGREWLKAHFHDVRKGVVLAGGMAGILLANYLSI